MKKIEKNVPTSPMIVIITPAPLSEPLIAIANPEKKKAIDKNMIIVQDANLP